MSFHRTLARRGFDSFDFIIAAGFSEVGQQLLINAWQRHRQLTPAGLHSITARNIALDAMFAEGWAERLLPHLAVAIRARAGAGDARALQPQGALAHGA